MVAMVRTSLAPIAAAAALVAAAVAVAQASPEPAPPVTHVVRGTVGTDTLWAVDGRNRIAAGKGADTIWLRVGRGRVNCGPGHDVVDASRAVRRHFRLRHCETVR
jgi:hypothetical protein